ncbi:MAG: hypothetical protein AMK72_08910 [Planctomycetes bacterium SM23_25]|nr:MAG: hypothetical protein AMK72_08910 [Planctomycetes bacterium SM23_25]
MMASATGEMRLVIPLWGSIVLVGAGAVYVVFGSRWPRLFNVLSMTFLGCIAGMVLSAWVPLGQPVVIVIGGVLLGGLSAFLRHVAHAILGAVVLAAVFSTLTANGLGEQGYGSYLVLNLSDTSYSTQWSGPNLARDPVLAAFLTGLLVGATVAVVRVRFSRRLIASAQGAALILVGLVELVAGLGGGGQASLAAAYPMTLSACWLCLVAIGLVVQRTLEQRAERWDTEDESMEEGV